MEIEDAGGTGTRKPDRREKDDVYTPPVHKTEEFRDRVKRLRERDERSGTRSVSAPKPEPEVKFNVTDRDYGRGRGTNRSTEDQPKKEVPMPTAIAPKKKRGGRHSSSFDQKLYEAELYKAVKEKVIKEMPTPSMGVTKKKYDERVEKETKRLVDVIKRPRYVMLADGTPFHLTKQDERADLERSLLDEPAWKRRITLAKYDIANGVEKVLQWAGTPATRVKEHLTDDDEGNVLGSVMQLGLNSAMLGVEYLKAGDYPVFASEERLNNLLREAEALKYTDPEKALEVRLQAEDMRKGIELKKEYKQRLDVASAAVDRAWEKLFRAAELNRELGEKRKQDMEQLAKETEGMTLQEAIEYTKKKNAELEAQYGTSDWAEVEGVKRRQEAGMQARSLRAQAATAYANGDYEKAIALTRQAQTADRDAEIADPYGAYSWIREPEREEKFLQDAALLELQKGAPLDDAEIRRLKEYHANSWTEFTGEMIFDPVNLIPGAIMDDIIKLPVRGLSKANRALAEAFPAYAKTVDVLGSPVRWLARESVTSGANRVARQTYNIMERISNGYNSSEAVTKALDEISGVVLDANRATSEQEARAIFETARQQIPGLQQITFKDFKQLMDAGQHVDPTEWSKLYSDALTTAEENLRQSAKATGKAEEEVLSDISKSRWALEEYSGKFYDAFKDPHRIFKGARLTDDTVAGWVTKTMRELSGDDVNELLVKTKFDEWLVKKSEKLGTRTKETLKQANRWIESSLNFAAVVRDLWATTVLTTFRWPINNMMDTSMRSVVWGGNLWDDMVTLFTSTQRTLADELGIAPLEFNQALSRQDLKFTESVPHRLLYEGWKPKAGIFSYIGAEYKRLLIEQTGSIDNAIVKSKLLGGLIEKLPEGQFKRAFAGIMDGYNYRVNLLTAIRAMPGGISDFNTAIEFTFRLRMFHTEYFKLLKKLEPRFAERGMDALNPATREIAKQIWRASEGNPRRITAYVDNLLGGGKNTPTSWSMLVPQKIDETLGRKMDIADKELFVSSVKNELDEFIETAARNGQELTPDDYRKFMQDYKTKMQDEIQERLSMAHDYRDIDGSIRTDGKPNPVLTEDDIQGSTPIPKAESPRNKEIEDAISKINRKNRRRKPVDITQDLETAISDYAKVERVSGDGVRVVRRDGALVVEVGDNALKKGAGKFYNQVNDAVISILKQQDTDLITRSGFTSVDQYEEVMRKFLSDPTEVLNADERQFLTLVNQMENHPNLRRIIEQTSPEAVRKYDSALDLYRDIGEYSDVYGFNRRPDEIFMSEAEKIRPMPGSHVAAANDARIAARKLVDLGQATSPEMADLTRDFIGQMQVYRQELKQFYAFTYPGPLMRSTTEAGRHTGWDLFYRLSETEFRKEADIHAKLLELLQKDPEAATKYMQEANDNFAEFFLRENGIELEWDADRQMIMNIKVQGLDGRARNFTSRRDIANLQIRFFSPQTRKAIEGSLPIRITKDPKLQLQRQLRNALRDTFQTDTAHADAWSKAIHSHAEKWANETGRPIEAYYERLGFQRIDSTSAKGLGTLEQTRIVKRGAIKKMDDGTFMFFGLSHSNFESMVRETSVLFFDDLVSMAEHSAQAADDLKALKQLIESKTGKPIRANRLEQAHSDVLSDVFSTYIATGHGPNISVKGGFDRMKAWLTSTFDAVRDTKIAGEIPDDTYRVLDRMFIESKLQDVPTTNSRTIQLMAKEANLVAQDEDELLRIINNALSNDYNLSPDEAAELQRLEDGLRAAEEEYQAAVGDLADLAGDNATANAMIGTNPAALAAQEKVDEAKRALDAFDIAHKPAGAVYQNLGDVPKDVAARILGTADTPLESKITKELQEGWDVWKTQRDLVGFPDEALADPDTFKAYLRQRMGEEWSEASNHYNKLLWEVEQLEDAMLNFHAGDDLRTTVFPRVHEAQMSDGMRTFVRNQSKMVNNYEAARTALDEWGEYLADLAQNGHPAALLTKEDQAALKAWAYGDGSKAKAELVDILLHGDGDSIEGAIDLVNKRMLDYQHTNVTDQFMKNWFPFWMFPSRSFPFWAETLATHPQLIAGYEKVQRLSRSQRYQAGAVTSQGKPLPSLDGYIKIPGTDMWFNPLAPFSFRYLLDIAKSKDDVIYAAQSEDDIDPKAFMANEFLQMGQVYGFSPAPWASLFVKKAFGIPDEIIPRYPLAPEIQMIPRWWVNEQIQRANKINLFGWDWQGIGETIYPEVPWHDYMVERRILENALQQVQSGNLSEEQKLKIMNQAQTAIKNKGDNALWQSTYKEFTSEESNRSIASFFTGLYTKQFGDGEADLLALRNEINLLKSSLNNEFQANVFDLPVTAEAGWNNYLRVLDTPEGWAHRLYTDIGWVRNGEGELIRDPKERAKWLATKIEQDEDQQMYYDKMSNLQSELNKRLRALPIGSDWEQVKIIYDWYSKEVESLDYLRTFEKVYGTNKPTELIQKDIARDWFRQINATKPTWNYEGGESYTDYQQRVLEWEANLPNIAGQMMNGFERRRDLEATLRALHPDQRFDTGAFFAELVGMTNKEGLELYQKETDDEFDALNKAWKSLYWDEYWNGVIGKDGYEVDLAERDFAAKHPTPPSTDELYAWIVEYYGPEKFTRDQIAKWSEDADALSVEERVLQTKDDPKDYKTRQEIWDMLSWIGPGNKNRGVFEQAFINAGGDPDWLTTWYQESGEAFKTKPEKLAQLHGAVQDAISTLGLKPPERAELVRYVQAQKENETFKQLVTTELGKDFYDYVDEDGLTQQGIYSYYNSLDTQARKQFRRDYPEEYQRIRDFYGMKETFQDDHPTWADYYGFDTEPSVTLPTDETGSVFVPPSMRSFGGGGGGGGRGGGGGGKAQYRPTFQGYDQAPQFNISSRTSNFISSGLYQLVGNKMAWEITNLMSGGKKISNAGISFLQSVRSRYPQYASEIDRILSKGT